MGKSKSANYYVSEQIYVDSFLSSDIRNLDNKKGVLRFKVYKDKNNRS